MTAPDDLTSTRAAIEAAERAFSGDIRCSRSGGQTCAKCNDGAECSVCYTQRHGRALLAEVRRLTADRDRWRVSCERVASDENDNAADLERVTKERDEVRAALATARLDGAWAMQEALAPFAAYAGVYTDDAPDDAIVLRHVGATATRTLTIGDFRRALDPAAVVGSGS